MRESGRPQGVVFVAVFLLAAMVVAAAADGARDHLIINGGIAVDQGWTDNIRSQAGTIRQQESYTNVSAAIGGEQGRFRLFPRGFGLLARGHVFYRFPQFDYMEIQPYATYSFGRRTELRLDYRFSPKRLLFDREEDGGEGVFFDENSFAAELRHKFGRRKRLRVNAGVEFEWRDFEPPNGERDSFTPTGFAETRYQIWSFLTPRVGFEYGRREARRENFDREELKATAGFDVRLFWGTVLGLRYARSWRDYTVDQARDPTARRNSNHRRDDDIDKYEVRFFAPIRAVPGLVTHVRYRYTDASSTRPDRNFTRNEVVAGFSYALAAR